MLMFLQVIAESLSEEEIAGLKEMFKMIDADNSGQITLEELKNGLERVGANLKDSEILNLMQAVSSTLRSIKGFTWVNFTISFYTYNISTYYFLGHLLRKSSYS